MAIITNALFDEARYDQAAFDALIDIVQRPTEMTINSSSFYKNLTLWGGDNINNSIKKNDTSTPLKATLEDVNGPIDLSTAQAVKLYMKKKDGTVKINGKEMGILDATGGRVKYDWETQDIDEPDVYHLEIIIDYPLGYEVVPNYGATTMVIDESIKE